MVSAQRQTPAPRLFDVLNTTDAASNGTSKLGSLLGYPSRLLHRVRSGLDELLYQEDQAALAYAASHDDNDALRSRYGAVVMPGPWGFLTSGYVVGLFAMALILNRIQNIVVPPRHPLTYRAHRARQPYQNRGSVWRVMYHSVFPVDLSSTFCRLVLRIPSLYFLSKALALWTIILIQTADLFPSWQWGWLQAIGNWAATKEMEDVCWFTFASICGGLCVGALTRGLEGQGSPNSSPFNLFGYAFLLHIYSSPLTHTKKPLGLPSRPDAHVVITIILPLLQVPFSGYDHWCLLNAFQVVLIHALGIKQRWARQRLAPTTLCALLTLAHFHWVLWFSEKPYPLLNYLPCVLESTLAAITLLTVALNALTQLLLEGAVTRPLFGHAAALLPRWDEDFSVALLRLGTASLEATSVAGLGNEVGGVTAADPALSLAKVAHTEYGEVELNRFGVASISHTIEARGRRRRRKEGFANEIRNVRTGTGQDDVWWDAVWYKELARFGVAVWKMCRGFGRWVWNVVRMKPTALSDSLVVHQALESPTFRENDERDESDEEGVGEAEGNVYERFLREEAVSDDEEEYRPTDSALSDDDGSDSDEEDEPAVETVKLYADLSESSVSRTGADSSVLLAHMTNATPSPLTRRRYRRLAEPGGEASSRSESYPDPGKLDVLDAVARERRLATSSQRREPDDDSRRNCVVCTVEPRQIICWPCRCLALCDDCRENIASRSAASKHTCPCCRRPVEGYSRIFVP
ncbi:hypothetical protein GLOTRDRAFT_136638 [Gloeophyllum trabeum ATCC 11539]|uniref:RING-type domain-containing protein n=1 Tax=Gloeophyllum trabeum (strain ATCC 11539 / FP-39264 / Madison 617) TaxID=670483 RepID=S7QEC6_GLOTA|nr:uncharacterized protein GLOTRDRAFT_136638 [Gloeophyllum trabeum ATCC 11539]EPQ57762.1 hypothetical protein GLOTRDRAFT_136638 [Gloeophyllum trabeum ATCC 11539]